MGSGQSATIEANSVSSRVNARKISRMPLIEDLIGNHNKIRSMIAGGEISIDALRKRVFSGFCSMEITDPGKKRALLDLLMEFTQDEMQRKDIETIAVLETTTSFDPMLSARHCASTRVFFDYLSRKLVAMKSLPALSAHESDYLIAIIFAMLDLSGRDSRSFRISKRLFTEVCENCACKEMKEIVSSSLDLLIKLCDPTMEYSYTVRDKKEI